MASALPLVKGTPPRRRSMIPVPEHFGPLFEEALDRLPGHDRPSVRRAREAAFARFQVLGFPGPKDEAWKYTAASRFAQAAYRLPERPEVAPDAVWPWFVEGAARLVFVNGELDPGLSDWAGGLGDGIALQTVAEVLAAGDHEVGPGSDTSTEGDGRSLTAFNHAFRGDGIVVRVDQGAKASRPLQILFVTTDAGGSPTLVSPANHLVLGAGASFELIETHVVLGAVGHLVNLVNTIEVGRSAILRHDRLQVGGPGATLVGRTSYRLGSDSRLTQTLATLGGGLVRNEIAARLEGSGIEATLNGLYATRERQHVDNLIRVAHLAPGSLSDQFYKGVLAGQSRAAFAGRIEVAREAQQTNAYQSNNNLLLSPDAEINTKPELEIFADDVKCSHGATAGELDERELFYLRSRGLDLETARTLMTYAFAGAVLERFGHPSAAEQARRELLRWLPGGERLMEMMS